MYRPYRKKSTKSRLFKFMSELIFALLIERIEDQQEREILH